MMNKARGDLYGSKIGKVREVDVDAFGSNRHDSFVSELIYQSTGP